MLVTMFNPNLQLRLKFKTWGAVLSCKGSSAQVYVVANITYSLRHSYKVLWKIKVCQKFSVDLKVFYTHTIDALKCQNCRQLMLFYLLLELHKYTFQSYCSVGIWSISKPQFMQQNSITTLQIIEGHHNILFCYNLYLKCVLKSFLKQAKSFSWL